jgi:hypothetical protein
LKILHDKGSRGLPLGCLPLWGREGVNLTTTTEYLLNNSKLRISTELIIR